MKEWLFNLIVWAIGGGAIIWVWLKFLSGEPEDDETTDKKDNG